MPSTKMFRDRVVSMEQTYEKGEKLLPLLQALIGEAIPGITFQEYVLDHEQDCFVMLCRTEAGAEKKISWTRMVLSDPERIPAVVENAQSEMRGRIVEYIRRRAERPFISVTFRHLEEGWVDTPEPKKPKPKPPQQQQPQQQQRQKGQAQPQRGERGGPQPAQGRGQQQQQRGPRERGAPQRPPGQPGPQPPRSAVPPPVSADGSAPQTPPPEGGGRRRRFRRRRGRGRGRGPGSGAPPGAPPEGGAPAS